LFYLCVWGEECPTAMNTPFDKAEGDFPEKDPLSRLPPREDSIKIWLRKLNDATLCKNTPFFWLYGGR
jgi:hypothetical protein